MEAIAITTPGGARGEVPHSPCGGSERVELIAAKSSASALTSFTPNAVWTVVSSRSRATSHM